jgi:hypothetical protein
VGTPQGRRAAGRPECDMSVGRPHGVLLLVHTVKKRPNEIPAWVTHGAGPQPVGRGKVRHPLVVILRHALPMSEFKDFTYGLLAVCISSLP